MAQIKESVMSVLVTVTFLTVWIAVCLVAQNTDREYSTRKSMTQLLKLPKIQTVFFWKLHLRGLENDIFQTLDRRCCIMDCLFIVYILELVIRKGFSVA